MDSLCRVCVKNATKSTSLSTKIDITSNQSFFDFLNKCTSLNACESDILPQGLCLICADSITKFYSLVKLAEKSDIILREALENSIETRRYYDKEMSCEEIIIRNEKIEEESGDFNKDGSFPCQTSNNSSGLSVYILDIVKEEPQVYESIAIADYNDAELNGSEKFLSNLDHPENSVVEADDIMSSIDDDLTNIDADHSVSEDDVPLGILKRSLIKNKDEIDFQNNTSSKRLCVNTHIEGQTDNAYKCIECNMVFNDTEEFRTHCQNHINGTKHECNICGKRFARHKYFHNHLVNHKEKKKYKCSICEKGFNYPSGLWKHIKMHSGEKPFKCEVCGKKFSLKETYDSHLLVHLNIKHNCPECGKVYKTKKYLLSHIDAHAAGKKYECEICSKKFSSKRYLNTHMENHKGISNKCGQCGKEFNNSITLGRHMKWHTYPNPFNCVNCGKSFLSKDSHTWHMERCKGADNSNQEIDRTGHNQNLYKCSICGKGFKHLSSRGRHIKLHSGLKPFECEICGKKFGRRYRYNTHLRVHARPQKLANKNHECRECSKKFSSKRYLNIHMENHNGIVKKCDQCNKEFKNSHTLSKHMKSHTEPNPFNCVNCGQLVSIKDRHSCHMEIFKAADNSMEETHQKEHIENTYKCLECEMVFKDRDEFRIHCRNHIDENKHECNICGKKFAKRNLLCSHLENHDEKRKYKCSICGKRFNHSTTRWRHMKIHSGEKPFECEVCGKKFILKDGYKAHLRVHTRPHKLTDKKKHKCDICSKKFKSKRYLNIHMENHNGIIKKCEQCDKEFNNSLTLSRHMKRHVNSRPFKCVNYGQSFSREDSHSDHIEICEPVNNCNEGAVKTEELSLE